VVTGQDIDETEAATAVEAVAERVVALIRSAGDPGTRVPRLGWTVGQVAAHLVVVSRVYTEAVQGGERRWMQPYLAGPDDTPRRLAAGNARIVSESPHDDRAALAHDLADGVQSFLAAMEGRPGDASVATPWYGEGQTRTLAELSGVLLGELVVHGRDIAETVRWRWPINPEHARLILMAVTSMLPCFVDVERARGMNATYMVHIRRGPRLVVRVADGTVSVVPAAARTDCHISADPVAFLLVSYGRLSQWGPIARGKLVAWGRRPWLALSFKSLFRNP
jgi:uncharacterized protein (TIGR03083 family)